MNTDTEMPLVSIPIIVKNRNSTPCILLRTHITDIDIIKKVISCAFHGRPIILMPIFTNKLRSLASLIEKGIIYRKGEEWYFLI